MPSPGVFRIDPPPVQRGPFAPIPAQGQAPPTRGREQTVLDCILRSWQPPDPLPTLPFKRFVAPQTFTYGQQPPIGCYPFAIVENAILRSWQPPDPQPQRDLKNIAPLTLSYGQQPPIGCYPFVIVENAILRSWQPPDPQPQRDRKNLAPLTLSYGQQPPIGAFLFSIIEASAIAWPPLAYPSQHQNPVAPITLAYGQPPPIGPGTLATIENTIVGYWQPPWIMPQTAPDNAAWNVPIVVVTNQPYTPLPQAILSAWQPDPSALPSRQSIAPLTQTYGDPPPILHGERDPDLFYQRTAQAWQPPDPQPQRLLPTQIVSVDNPPLQSVVKRSATAAQQWQPPDPQPQRDPKNVAPLTFTYGDPPPILAGERDLDLFYQRTAQAWQPSDPQPQRLLPTQIVSVDNPPLQSVVKRSATAAQQWQPPDPQPQRDPKNVAPLTFTYGQAPPIGPTLARACASLVRLAWEPSPPQPQRPLPIQITSVDNPPRWSPSRQYSILQSWQPADPPLARSAKTAPLIPIVVVEPLPFTRSALDLLVRSWQSQPITAQWRVQLIVAGPVPGTPAVVYAMLLDDPALTAVELDNPAANFATLLDAPTITVSAAMPLTIKLKDITLYKGMPRNINVRVPNGLIGQTLKARIAPSREADAQIETTLTYSGIVADEFGQDYPTFVLAISVSDMVTIQNEWTCDIVRVDTGAVVAQINFHVEPISGPKSP